MKKEFGLENFERFRWMCILSGCDYLDNIAGIGLAKAKKIMSRTQVSNIELVKFFKGISFLIGLFFSMR